MPLLPAADSMKYYHVPLEKAIPFFLGSKTACFLSTYSKKPVETVFCVRWERKKTPNCYVPKTRENGFAQSEAFGAVPNGIIYRAVYLKEQLCSGGTDPNTVV